MIGTRGKLSVLSLAFVAVTAATGLSAAHATTSSAGTAAAQPGGLSRRVAPAAIQNVTIPAKRIPSVLRFIPPWVSGGDREFGGHGPDVRVDANLLVAPHTIDVELAMTAQETEWNWTRARGAVVRRLYTAQPGRCIQSVTAGRFDTLQYRDTDHTADIFLGKTSNSFIQRYDVVGDTNGQEAGIKTGVAAFTKPFTVRTRSC
jgi:hypothetical protein